MLNFYRECWNPVKKHSKALVFLQFQSKFLSVYSADRGRADNGENAADMITPLVLIVSLSNLQVTKA